MKPDWKSAPKWAKWLAQDANGIWYWYEEQPQVLGNSSWFSSGGNNEAAATPSSEWRESLEQRPEVQL